MWSDNDRNLYSNREHNGRFDHHHNLREQQFVHNSHHHEPLTVSGSVTLEGSSNNGGIVSRFDHQTASNNLNLNLHLHPQGGSPIGLNLKKSPSLINLVETRLSQEMKQKKVDKPTPEKLKASNFSAARLQIGSWKRVSVNEGDLVAKLYYAKKKLVWEFLDGPLKSKIEIQWSEISAIRAFMYEAQPGLLEIELNQPPQFGREINPQPRKHTQWKQTTDFTGGQASICRRHTVIFLPAVLDKQYEKLLQCDNRLFNLSQQPFPVNNYPFFSHDPNAFLDYSYTDVRDHQPHSHFLGDLDSNSTMSVMRFTSLDEGAIIRQTNYNQDRFVQDHVHPYYGQEPWISIQESQTKTLPVEFDLTGYATGVVSGIDRLRATSGTGFQEASSWEGIQDLYGLPWEPIPEDLNQQYNPNWT